MPNASDLMQLISQSYGETATISYLQCQEIVQTTTQIYQVQLQICGWLFILIFGILIIKWLWNK